MRPELERVQRLMADGAAEGLHDAGEDLLGAAQLDAPIETGRLRGSGTIDPLGRGPVLIDRARRRLKIIVAFTVVYAARQHEEITWEHPLGGKAKYLEGNLLAMAPRYNRYIANKIRAKLKAAGA
jgi:hypothetical protein